MTKGSAILRDILDAARKQLLADFDVSKGFAHSGIKGDERAEALAKFLRNRLPPAYGVATGEMIDSRDRRSGQLDLIIYDQISSQPLHAGHKNNLYSCESVFAVIEVKSLFSAVEAKKCLAASQKIRRLRPFGKKFIDARSGGEPADNQHRCMYIVFSYTTDLSKSNWLKAEFERLCEISMNENSRINNIDRLIILDRGIINPSRMQGTTGNDDPGLLFTQFFLNLVNFLERERRRRPVLSLQDYLPNDKKIGWVNINQ